MDTQKNERKEKLRQVFEDTERYYQTDEILKKSIEESIMKTVIYQEGYNFQPIQKRFAQTTVSVNALKSLEAGMSYKKKNRKSKIGILSFASGTNPGGGVRNGSSAQEESICRCTTLAAVLDAEKNRKEFYSFHKSQHDQRYTSTVIYTPNIIAFKTDDDIPSLLPRQKWNAFDFISCAAPNLINNDLPEEEIKTLHEARARQILNVAAENKIEVLVLGAFGCGAFQNPPEVVAKAYKDMLKEFDGVFQEIVFAVFTTEKDRKNYDAFEKNFAKKE